MASPWSFWRATAQFSSFLCDFLGRSVLTMPPLLCGILWPDKTQNIKPGRALSAAACDVEAREKDKQRMELGLGRNSHGWKMLWFVCICNNLEMLYSTIGRINREQALLFFFPPLLLCYCNIFLSVWALGNVNAWKCDSVHSSLKPTINDQARKTQLQYLQLPSYTSILCKAKEKGFFFFRSPQHLVYDYHTIAQVLLQT